MNFIYQIGTEQVIHSVLGGLSDKSDDNAGYMGFDVYIGVDKNTKMRDIRIAAHLLRWSGFAIGCIDDDIITPDYNIDKNWELVSTHGSCWPDSLMRFINHAIEDICNNGYESEFCWDRYRDDGHRFDIDQPNVTIFPESCKLLSYSDIKGLKYGKDDGSIGIIQKW